MLTSPTHRRPIVLLSATLLVQILLLAIQIRRPGQVRLIRVWSVGLVTPIESAASWIVGRLGAGWKNYVSLHQVRHENEQLRRELNDLRMRTGQLESRSAEATRLAALLAFRDAHPPGALLGARIIGAGPGASRTVYLDRGENDGVRKDMGVITPEGVVGKVLEVYSSTSQVLLITDKDGGVGCLLAGSRTQGVARGQGEALLLLSYVNNDENVAIGESVLTSGIDRIFPKDIPVGNVVGMHNGNPFKVIDVRPAARLDRLEEVFVMLSRAEWEPPPATVPDSSPNRKAKVQKP
ncbi:MAG: rod shape-determining protein MreC [Acidipila sp.]|nr:rod shape-determining protein MreC [Acidipila sp.]